MHVGRTGNNSEYEEDSIRYYSSAPFLLVYSNGKGGLIQKVLFLPDTSKGVYAKPYSWFAKNNVELTFDKGVIKSSTSEGDSTALPSAIIDALKTINIQKYDSADKLTDDNSISFPAPKLFRININDDGSISLSGGKSLTQSGAASEIRIPVKAN